MLTTWVLAFVIIAFGAGFYLGGRRGGKVVWTRPVVPIPTPEVEALLASGQKIEAIKLYRQLHGTDLKDSKEAVEALARELPSDDEKRDG